MIRANASSAASGQSVNELQTKIFTNPLMPSEPSLARHQQCGAKVLFVARPGQHKVSQVGERQIVSLSPEFDHCMHVRLSGGSFLKKCLRGLEVKFVQEDPASLKLQSFTNRPIFWCSRIVLS